ncbi:Hypothetical protein MexAM1_META1p4301 [Methylorubrum extorquens AM1]|uniref:Uncharacterized protein n=1 Tax=Methylorubrum extorquens (strain ATCC 14718 / DSM 1338 / JCM 2805 / NCIMB 9133 / AM1) TaxID=272630 RepID=C5B2Q7_METEA|nr:Hypothetical protein MexAM1_META1p4301 [Methylorubrum extorquens AM1]
MPCFATAAMPPSRRSLRSDFGGGSGNHACRTRAEPEHKGRQARAMGALLKVALVLGVIPGPRSRAHCPSGGGVAGVL